MNLDVSYSIMNTNVEQILKNSEGRYFSEYEEVLLTNYYEQITLKCEAIRNIQDRENTIVKLALEQSLKEFPKMNNIPMIKSYLSDDLIYILRNSTLAIFGDNLEALKEKSEKTLFKWKELDFSYDFMNSLYTNLFNSCKNELYLQDYEILSSFISIFNPENFDFFDEINSKFNFIVNKAVSQSYERFPNMLDKDTSHEKGIKDLGFVLNICVLGALSNNPIYVKDKISYANSILVDVFKNNNDFIKKGFSYLVNECEKELSQNLFFKIKTYLNMIDIEKTNDVIYVEKNKKHFSKKLQDLVKNLSLKDVNLESSVIYRSEKILENVELMLLDKNYSYLKDKFILSFKELSSFYEIDNNEFFSNTFPDLINKYFSDKADELNSFIKLYNPEIIKNIIYIEERKKLIINKSIENIKLKDVSLVSDADKNTIVYNYISNSLNTAILFKFTNSSIVTNIVNHSFNSSQKEIIMDNLIDSCKEILPSNFYSFIENSLKSLK